MIDPILSLAFSAHANKGVYALLLGSGTSRSAGIPTGWEIVLDLTRKLARLKGADCEPDPAVWYESAFGEVPDYPKLLEAIASSPAERSQLLRNYFEATPEVREQGLKVPKPAHEAIAQLVTKGYFRVIVTTNFDRLIETALEEVGVKPTVISTPDAVEGALPLVHTNCTVIKLHGDYRDARVKNSPAELDHYDERIQRLLDQVFDEYGLIVCGWSAEWDAALRAALQRCKSRRFTTYWTMKGEPSDAAKKLVRLRRASLLKIGAADAFFSELAEKVLALEEGGIPHPVSAQVAVATLKRYLPREEHTIRLHDFVMEETRRVSELLSVEHFPTLGVPFSNDEAMKRVQRYEGLTEILRSMFVTGCFWGRKGNEKPWVMSLNKLSELGLKNGTTAWLQLRKYPALLVLYAGGIASVASGKYETFAALLTRAQLRENDELPIGVGLNTYEVLDRSTWNKLRGGQQNYLTPLSDHLCSLFEEPLKEYLPTAADYEEAFDRFEYMLGLVCADLGQEREAYRFWGPVGSFGWRHRNEPKKHITVKVESEMAAAGDNWAPLRAGLFGGSLERAREIKTKFDQFVPSAISDWY